MKTAYLTGPAQSRAVAKCENWKGWGIDIDPYNPRPAAPRYSTDWPLGGPIIEREGICVYHVKGSLWGAELTTQVSGPTPLIAGMRCYVASKLGDEVEISEDLK